MLRALAHSSALLLALTAAAADDPSLATQETMPTAKTLKPKAVKDPLQKELFDVQESVLPNGLRVRLVRNSNVPLISLYTFFKVGSRNERPGITGISHLFEHMMFNGAKKYGPKAFDRVLERHGGYSNAYTTTDMTVYHDEFPSEALETVLDLESDRMRSLSINDKSLKAEREVVKEERRARVDNEIMGIMDEELDALLFKAHPYRWPVIGWMADIENIRREDCEEFFATYYAPNNAVVYVVGDIDFQKTLKLVKRYYGDIKKGPALPRLVDPEPEQKGERRSQIHHPAQAPSLLVGYRAPAGDSNDTFVLDVIQYVLSVGEGSRLSRGLVYDKELALHVGMDWAWRIDRGILLFYVELKPATDVRKVEAALYAELEKISKEGITERELQKAKNNLNAHLLRELSTNSGRANSFGTYELLLGSWRAATTLPEKYEAVTLAQVKETAAKYFAPTQRSVVTLVPEPMPQ